MKGKIIFQEKQRFTQWWLWLIIIGSIVVIMFQFNWDEDLVGQLTIDKVMPSVIIGFILVLFLSLRLTTTITDDEITVRYIPFIKKVFKWSELSEAQVIDYGFVGGWGGIRLWTNYGTVYNVTGSKGLHIKMAGRQYVIGTQKEKELQSSIAHLL
ncbi:hypothetical protein JCM19314_101 [Nonlabens ulvanivorans]|uniref:Uncharacterized protein n=1 Tax=Nonlabens ulvanivorans TaxID=906888 RepID=A0A090QCQ5_NONUL|nr:hypothetical protein [Nonlabens ulvanivorans]GAL00875.1 hypothetical protein JCM19314_101 [Nonlabens ulvanivorans]